MKFDPPQKWLEEIAAGTEFGERAKKAIAVIAKSKGMEAYYAPKQMEPKKSRIGTRLGEIFRERVGAVSCGPCAAAIRSLDKMTPEEVREKEDEIVAEIAARAQKNMPNFWRKLLVKVDQSLGIGATEHFIREYLREACQDEANASLQHSAE